MGVFDQITALAAEYRNKVNTEGKALLKAHFDELFEVMPDLVGVRWTQFTPYFNDGDPCEFRVSGFYYKFTDTAEDAGDYEDGYISSYNKDCEKHEKVLRKYAKIPEDVLETVFGDHVKVTATREGFDVEQYSHD